MAAVFFQGFIFYLVCRVIEEGFKSILKKMSDD